MPRKMIAGNWKMNGTPDSVDQIAALMDAHADAGVDILICPPATLIAAFVTATADSPLTIGGQDCHTATTGAHTGDISAMMLTDAGATHVITGHSERRADHGEDDALVRAKTQAAHSAGLTAVICIGETLAQREAGETLDVVTTQLTHSTPDGATPHNTVIAYEPIWAIGTGKVPTTDQIADVHGALRITLRDRFGKDGDQFRLLYGGSVKPNNAADIFAINDVDGALVGGASLKASDFSPIIKALEKT